MHFSNKEHIYDLFKEFKIIHMEHKSTDVIDSKLANKTKISSWNFIARLEKQ